MTVAARLRARLTAYLARRAQAPPPLRNRQLRVTKVGLWFLLLAVVVGIAATNTGNNALYMVVASMLSLIALSWIGALLNLGTLRIHLEPPDEIFANAPFTLTYRVESPSRWLDRWLLQIEIERGRGVVIPHLERRRGDGGGGVWQGEQQLLLPRRGRVDVSHARVSSLFPFGLFRRTAEIAARLDVIVFPELFPAASLKLHRSGNWGAEPSRRSGWGHDLHALRGFRAGDDPRGIHWKQSARTGKLVYKERESEENRRLSIVLDNAVGPLERADDKERFERLISEAATATVDYLGHGFEVELVTRDEHLPFSNGRRQRLAILTSLALLAPTRLATEPLRGSRNAPELRLVLDRNQSRGVA